MELDRKPAVGRGHEDAAPRDAEQFGEKPRLARAAADMFEHRARMDEVERGIGERQIAAVGPHEPQPGITRREEGGIVEADRGDLRRIGPPRFEIVGVVVKPVAGSADVEQGVAGSDAGAGDKGGEHLAALVRGDADRQRARTGEIVLRVDAHAARAAGPSACGSAGTGRLARISSTLTKNAAKASWKPSRISVPDGITRRIARVAESGPKSPALQVPSA